MFWKNLSKPISILAPMYDVTDTVFREIIACAGKPDVLYTEFVNCDALATFASQSHATLPSEYRSDATATFASRSDALVTFASQSHITLPSEYRSDAVATFAMRSDALATFSNKNNTTTRNVIEDKFLYSEKQRPVVAQIWGVNPETHYTTAKYLANKSFDGIDINMGCPQKSEMKVGACAALIDNPQLAAELIQATKAGAGNIPVSVKTRTGIKTTKTEKWIEFLLEQDLAAITIHARTAQQMSKVPADWSEIKKAVELRNLKKSSTLIIGNGDVTDYKHGQELCDTYGCDGYMIGRGIFKNPWAFVQTTESLESNINKKEMLLTLAVKHLTLYKGTYTDSKNYNIIKKFFKVYVNGFENAGTLRTELMETKSPDNALAIISEQLSKEIK